MEGTYVVHINRPREQFLYRRPGAAETPTPPFRPGVAGRMAFFFGPIAGAFVASINLRRMGQPDKASKVRSYTFLIAVIFGIVILVIPDVLGRLLGLGGEIASYAIFPRIQDESFNEWQRTNPGIEPSSGWKAIGWGLIGLLIFMAILIVLAIVMGAIGIPIS